MTANIVDTAVIPAWIAGIQIAGLPTVHTIHEADIPAGIAGIQIAGVPPILTVHREPRFRRSMPERRSFS